MKYLTTILALLISGSAFSQIVLGDRDGSNPDPVTDTNYHSSVLLDFSQRNDSGLILPYVRALPQAAEDLVEGTLLLDASDKTQAAVKFYNGSWVDLSSNNRGDVTAEMDDQPLPSEVDEAVNEAKMIIGADHTDAGGVLVLEADDKAMILPMVTDTDLIVNPSPGMIVYLNKPGAKRLAVFNGNKWTFWQPSTN